MAERRYVVSNGLTGRDPVKDDQAVARKQRTLTIDQRRRVRCLQATNRDVGRVAAGDQVELPVVQRALSPARVTHFIGRSYGALVRHE